MEHRTHGQWLVAPILALVLTAAGCSASLVEDTPTVIQYCPPSERSSEGESARTAAGGGDGEDGRSECPPTGGERPPG